MGRNDKRDLVSLASEPHISCVSRHTETPLSRWLVYLGIDAAGLSRRLGLHHNAVGLAAVRGSRSCRWLREAELLLSVPARVLVSIPPDDPRTAPYRTTALVASAEWRLRNQAG